MNLLEELVRRGFTFQVFEECAKQLGVVKHNCVMLLDVTDQGRWVRFSSAGYLMDGQIGLLIERGGQKVFVRKSAEVPAEGELLARYREFVREVEEVLARQEGTA